MAVLLVSIFWTRPSEGVINRLSGLKFKVQPQYDIQYKLYMIYYINLLSL